jgi:hypothetical protein
MKPIFIELAGVDSGTIVIQPSYITAMVRLMDGPNGKRIGTRITMVDGKSYDVAVNRSTIRQLVSSVYQ